MILTGNKPKKARSGIACTLIRFSLPLIFSGILQQLYNWRTPSSLVMWRES